MGDRMIAATILDDAVRRTLPATVRELCAATGVSEPTLHRHLTRLRLLGCVTRTAPRQGAADVWHEAPGATWRHLRDMGVSVGDGYPRLVWDRPTRRATHRGWHERHEAHRMLAWEAYPAGADDYDDRGIPVAPGAVVLVWHAGGGEQVQTTHDDIDAAKAHAEATLRMRGML